MSIWDDLLGRSSAEASGAAAGDTYEKMQTAAEELRGFGDNYAQQFKQLSELFAPYAKGGESALRMLMAGLGLGGDTEGFTNAYRSLPGYEAGLRTGTDAVTRGLNTTGMLNSGRAMKTLQRFGSDYEDQRVGSYLDRLTGLSGMGQQATGQQVATQGQGLQGQLAARTSAYGGQMQAAPVLGQGMVAGEQAKQSALTNLLGTGAYLLGSYWGGGKK